MEPLSRRIFLVALLCVCTASSFSQTNDLKFPSFSSYSKKARKIMLHTADSVQRGDSTIVATIIPRFKNGLSDKIFVVNNSKSFIIQGAGYIVDHKGRCQLLGTFSQLEKGQKTEINSLYTDKLQRILELPLLLKAKGSLYRNPNIDAEQMSNGEALSEYTYRFTFQLHENRHDLIIEIQDFLDEKDGHGMTKLMNF